MSHKKLVTAPSDTEILEALRQAFVGCQRPKHFTNHTHCCECAEHDELLRGRDVDTLRIGDVGNPAFDPICFITPEGFAYYLPALARLALEPLVDSHGWYGEQLLFHVRNDGPRNRRFLACSPNAAAVGCGISPTLGENEGWDGRQLWLHGRAVPGVGDLGGRCLSPP